jgi:hypothetical protein
VICPHCQVSVAPNFNNNNVGQDPELGGLRVHAAQCPSCDRLIVTGEFIKVAGRESWASQDVELWPDRPARPAPPDVDPDYVRDFQEAAAVLPISAKGSAALSRRLLQHILREKGGFKGRNLDTEIDMAIESNTLSAALAEDLDALRTVGNFAAHPIKTEHTGEVVDVEPGEAEWLLDLLDELLQHYFTREATRERRRAGVNAKLRGAGKNVLKGTPEDEDEDVPPPAVLGSG